MKNTTNFLVPVSSDNVRAFHIGEGHALFTAIKTTDVFRFYHLMSLWFLYMYRLGLRRYMHALVLLLSLVVARIHDSERRMFGSRRET